MSHTESCFTCARFAGSMCGTLRLAPELSLHCLVGCYHHTWVKGHTWALLMYHHCKRACSNSAFYVHGKLPQMQYACTLPSQDTFMLPNLQTQPNDRMLVTRLQPGPFSGCSCQHLTSHMHVLQHHCCSRQQFTCSISGTRMRMDPCHDLR